MATVMIHATVSLDGFMADPDGGMDWAMGFTATAEDEAVAAAVVDRVGAVVGGANRSQTIEDGEAPYGGVLGVPVFLLTHTPHEPVEKDGTTYTFVVDDVAAAVAAAARAAGDRTVSLLGGKISRQCLVLGLVDEIQLHVVPVLLGDGIPLFTGLGRRIDLERLETSGYADETHLRFRVLVGTDADPRSSRLGDSPGG